MHLLKALYLEKNSLHHMVFFMFVEEVWSQSSNEMTSCFMAEKMALDDPLFCTGSLWEAF